ncbi:hypothetical protein VHEMI07112 [[Torrubiella] hemipterigena]|uniref:Acetylxylan esterase n=1 Tax=[Torrubiella] hemipterigena TaxID=1531966 RepID=A0A0A1T2I6_9HYPO|nr:hypothetical protein VHEMI07112 [[Torrubiella] hemipterigena]
MTIVLKTLAVAALACAAPLDLGPRVTCVPGLYMIVARGSLEPAGEGRIGAITKAVKAQVPGSSSVAVDYPATIVSGTLYPESVYEGIIDAKKKVHNYVATCGDDSRIVLIGYSQGGNVISDMLAGGVLKPMPLDATYRNYIKSVVTFADPTFAANQTYDYGTNAKGSDGIFSRSSSASETALLEPYADIMAAYCDANDSICASGQSTAVHRVEVENHAQEAIDFIVAHR